MKALLSLALCLSVTLNIWLFYRLSEDKHPRNTSDIKHIQTKAQTHRTQASQPESQQSNQPQANGLSQSREQLLFRARQLLQRRELVELQQLLQNHLKSYPRDMDFLLLEADYLYLTEPPNYALTHYMGLFSLPLGSQQKQQLQEKVQTLVNKHIKGLREAEAWAILITLLEPLWNIAPNNREISLPLAEAYAEQNLPSATRMCWHHCHSTPPR